MQKICNSLVHTFLCKLLGKVKIIYSLEILMYIYLGKSKEIINEFSLENK